MSRSLPSDMLARECRFCCIDFETTGAVPGYMCLPWQVGTCRVVAGVVDVRGLDSLICVPMNHRFNVHTPGVYRKYRAELASAPMASEIWPAIHAELVPAIAVAHNIGTERKQLAQMAPMSDYGPWVDTLRLARRIYPGLESYALDDLMVRLGLQARVSEWVPDRSAHDAYYDAVACGVLLAHFLTLPGWDRAPMVALI